jgi:hypothetical protein
MRWGEDALRELPHRDLVLVLVSVASFAQGHSRWLDQGQLVLFHVTGSQRATGYLGKGQPAGKGAPLQGHTPGSSQSEASSRSELEQLSSAYHLRTSCLFDVLH